MYLLLLVSLEISILLHNYVDIHPIPSLSDCCNIRFNCHLFFVDPPPIFSNMKIWICHLSNLFWYLCTDVKEIQIECQDPPSSDIFSKICKRSTWLWNKTWNIATNFWYTHSQQQGAWRTPLLIALGMPEQAVLIMHTHSWIFCSLCQVQWN